jgi:molybdenum cofactor cytidylyltransferase
MADVAAIVLAAGRASRFSGGAEGKTKLVEVLGGKPLVRHAAEAALASGARPVIVVTGHARDLVMAALDGLPVQEAFNPVYASGIASSVVAGVGALPATGVAVLVFLGDMPRVTADLARRLLAAFHDDPSCDAVVPLVGGRRGNPVLIARSQFGQVAGLRGDEGARRLLGRPGLRVREIEDLDGGSGLDIDTPDALLAARGPRG